MIYFFFKVYRIEKIESWHKYWNTYHIVKGTYRFSPTFYPSWHKASLGKGDSSFISKDHVTVILKKEIIIFPHGQD